MTKRSALVLGANAGQADLIRYLTARDWHVTALAHKEGGAGWKIADDTALVNIKDAEGVTAYGRETGPDLIYSVSSDLAVPAVVKASEALGLPHYFDMELVDLLDSKQALRGFLNARGLSPVPFMEATVETDLSGWNTYPCMVKPSNAQGQRGVQKLEKAEDLIPAVTEAVRWSSDATAIIEGFLKGVEISSNVLVRDGEILVNQVSERLVHTKPEHLGIPRGHTVPVVDVSAANVAAAEQLVRDVVAAIGVRDGTLYFQMIVTEDGPRIVEIAPRLDGCHVWRVIKAATGVDYLDLAVRGLLNEPTDGALDAREPDGIYELIFQQTPPGQPFSKAEFPIPEDALYHEYRYEDGEDILPINGRLEVVGYYVRRRKNGE